MKRNGKKKRRFAAITGIGILSVLLVFGMADESITANAKAGMPDWLKVVAEKLEPGAKKQDKKEEKKQSAKDNAEKENTAKKDTTTNAEKKAEKDEKKKQDGSAKKEKPNKKPESTAKPEPKPEKAEKPDKDKKPEKEENKKPAEKPKQEKPNKPHDKPERPQQRPEDDTIKIADGKITCDSFGRFSGQYVEDGRDELVESVATVLVTNQSEEYLEYATLTFDIDGQAANFIVTGLPAKTSAWVMDANKLIIETGASFTYQNCESSFRNDVDSESEDIEVEADGNMLLATNQTEETMNDVVVYYRVMHTDGNYLGGITYTANFDTLEPGESKEVLAGHYSADDSEIVRISWNNSEQ